MTETAGDGNPAAPDTPPHLIPKVPPPPRSPEGQDDSTGGADAAGSGDGGGGSRSGSGRRRRRGGRGRGGGGGGQNNAQDQDGQGQQNGGQRGQNQGNGGQRQGGRSQGDGGQQQGGQGQGGKNRDGQGGQNQGGQGQGGQGGSGRKRRRRGGRGRGGGGGGQGGQNRPQPVEATAALDGDDPVELDEEALARRRGRSRKGRPVGRYLMAVHGDSDTGLTQISVLEGRNLIEHYVSRPSDNVTEIHGNIYLGRVQNVLPGMEAAFVDIGTPKNAVLYRGDVSYDPDEVEKKGDKPRIEDMLKAKQVILCQVTKNPIAHKGARLTTEVSLPGRFVVLVPNQADTFGISKRLPDPERKRLRSILDKVKPEGHGLIVRTAAEDVTAEEIERDVARLAEQWRQIEQLANSTKAPALLYTEPDMAVRVIREEFNKDYRSIVIDDRELYDQVASYMKAVTPALAERIEYYDAEAEGLPLFERHHVYEQVMKALDRKVWLPSGGSLIIEHTEALTVIDVNTGKNVGKSSLEETVFRNNLEAAEEIAKQLRLRDIGGIIVIDFVDMEETKHRKEVVKVFREALARDKTRTQVYDVSDLGLVEMTRKRIGEGLLESMSKPCDHCTGRGVILDAGALGR
ncbi:MAG: Rne/Rng family ribonuclease [Actinomycetota bacterium]